MSTVLGASDPETFAFGSRIEDASLNASAPPQQRWIDGWLVRFSPGKARRARSINAVAEGRYSLDERLQTAGDIYRAAGLPLVVRLTPFTQPGSLDAELAARGFVDEPDGRTMVMALRTLPTDAARQHPLPPGFTIERVGTHALAQAAGALRQSPLAQRQAHAQRLELSPVPFVPYLVKRHADGATVACGQVAIEGNLIGVYDIITAPDARGQGLARALCGAMLADQGKTLTAPCAYLQVEANNAVAQRVYRRMGFADLYEYHYRSAPT